MSDLISRQEALNAVSWDTEAYMAINMLPSAQKKGEWIPCSEYLPMDFEDVLVWYEYFRYGDYNRMYQTYGISNYDSLHDIWGGDVNGHKARVIAWMPLPEPYEPQERNE